MKLYLHFAVVGFSNSYLIGPDDGGDAVLIDPGVMSIELLNLIEKNGLYVRYILITHNHYSHVDGIRTLRKIYDFDVYSAVPAKNLGESITIEDDKTLQLGEIRVQPLVMGGHSPDSLVFRIEHMVFTGDTLSAGKPGTAPNNSSRSALLASIKERIVPMKGNPLIFPGHGPPSTLESELQFNPYLNGQKEIPGTKPII